MRGIARRHPYRSPNLTDIRGYSVPYLNSLMPPSTIPRPFRTPPGDQRTASRSTNPLSKAQSTAPNKSLLRGLCPYARVAFPGLATLALGYAPSSPTGTATAL
jgi:hypothetical protein